jgi:hypothetical protein
MEYTYLVIFSFIINFLLDNFILQTKLFKQRKFYILLGFVVVLQTIFDNWLNGRWNFDGYIVGPYGEEFYSKIVIWNTPLENYLYGISLVWMNLIVFEFLIAKISNRKSEI